jgi:uncharacterized protein
LKKHFTTWLRFAFALFLAVGVMRGFSAEVIPPKPTRYFNDYAGVTSTAMREQLNRKLEDFEKTDSSQIVVVVFRKMQSESSIDDYTLRVAQNWGVGQKGKSNGAILFVFVEDRKMFLQVGYGLEGAIPDIIAKDITENRIKPFFRTGNYNAGLNAGVDAIIRAARGEYKGTGRTVAQGQGQRRQNGLFFLAALLFFGIMGLTRARRRGHIYNGSGRRRWGGPIIWTGGGGSGWGGGGGGGGGGSFSSGGGGFGGGGAGSSW